MKRKLSTQLSAGFALLVLVLVVLISLAANLLINRQFRKYVEGQQKDFADNLARGLADQYNTDTKEWNLDYIHGFGMYALNDGYVIKIYDAEKSIVWDAENHDMTLCHQIMGEIRQRMQELKASEDGDFVTHKYDLEQNGEPVGYAEISYYSPYFFNENAFQFVDSLNRILVIVGGVCLIGAVLTGILLARRISNPIVKTIEITREISDGNYEVRFASEVRISELNELTEAVNHMAEMLGKQDLLRKRLTTDIAHELRTPLANVSSYLEAILEGVWEATPERLQNCYDELGRLSGIVSDLEHLRQIENENLVLSREPVDLLELAGTVYAAFEPELLQRKLNCQVEGETCIINGDKKRLHQVVHNLLSNAVKYSREGGQIRITIEDSAACGKLLVEDNGIGISEEDLPYIFERFYRADRSRNRKTGGSGIGLTIVKAIVRAHNGKITVKSQKGRGTQVLVELPKDCS